VNWQDVIQFEGYGLQPAHKSPQNDAGFQPLTDSIFQIELTLTPTPSNPAIDR
jgi:hypothetical protein